MVVSVNVDMTEMSWWVIGYPLINILESFMIPKYMTPMEGSDATGRGLSGVSWS